MISVCIPTYNQEKFIRHTLHSAASQRFNSLEIVIIDDCSSDNTFKICQDFKEKFSKVKLFKNETNIGLAQNLNRLVKESSGEIIVFLCGDDTFTNKDVLSDIFNNMKYHIGVIGRYFYQTFDYDPKPVMVMRGNDILPLSCQPSGMAFKREAILEHPEGFSEDIFCEVPSMVKKIIDSGWSYRIIKYDTVAAKLHLGKDCNAAANEKYYDTKKGQSPTENWSKLLGKPKIYFYGFVQMKNRNPKMLMNEILVSVKLKPIILLNPLFWFFALISMAIPSDILSDLSVFYRKRITSLLCSVIERGRNAY